MKTVRISSTPETQRLLGNIITKLPKKGLSEADQVSYFLHVTEGPSLNSEFIMSETKGIIQKILLYIDYKKTPLRSSLIASIDSNTGDIIIPKKFFKLLSKNVVIEKISKLLEMLQPENLAKLEEITKKSSFDILSEAKFEGFTIQESVYSSSLNPSKPFSISG